MDVLVLEDNGETLKSVQNRTSVTSLTIPATVRRIEKNAFYGCTLLVSIELPEGLEEIGEDLFQDCESVTSLTIPSTVRRIQDGAFYNCTSLVSIVLPEGLEEIGVGSFEYCESLTSLTIPTTVQQIHCGAFKRCTSLASIELPMGLKQVGTNIFEGSFLKSIRLSISPTRYYELLCKDDTPEHDENRDLVLRGRWSTERLRVFQATHVLVYKSLPLRYWAMFLERCSSEPDAIFYILSRKNVQI